jgi:hypothetical protein
MAPVDRPRSFSILPTVLSLLIFRGIFPTSFPLFLVLPVNPTFLFKPYYVQIQSYLRLTRGTSQKINKIIAMMSKTQRIGPVKKPMEKPSTHKTRRIIPIIKSKVSILTSFRS